MPSSLHTSEFLLEPSSDLILRRGKIFEAGDYPDKAFALTPEEMAQAVEAFQPVEVDLEHVPTVLSGKLGTLQAVEAQGGEMFGTVALPRWLDDLLEDGSRKVSCTWDREQKRLIGLALVRSPRVTDAALMAAFHGSTPQDEVLLGPEDGADGSDGTEQEPDKETTMSISDALDQLKTALLGREAATETATAAVPAQMSVDNSAALKAAQDEIDRLKAAAFTAQTERIQADAVAFAESEIDAKRSLPAERAYLITAFSTAATDDVLHPTAVTFGEGKTGSRVDALKAAHAARTPHQLTSEMVPTGEETALFNKGNADDPTKEKPLTAERRAELLGLSELGQTVLNGRRS